MPPTPLPFIFFPEKRCGIYQTHKVSHKQLTDSFFSEFILHQSKWHITHKHSCYKLKAKMHPGIRMAEERDRGVLQYTHNDFQSPGRRKYGSRKYDEMRKRVSGTDFRGRKFSNGKRSDIRMGSMAPWNCREQGWRRVRKMMSREHPQPAPPVYLSHH